MIRLSLLFLMVVTTSCLEKRVGPDEYIDITVSKDTIIPTCSWEEGPANELSIQQKSTELTIWAIHTPDVDRLSSPVVYGVKPEGAELLLSALQ